MRCDDLTRELASPTGAYSPDALAGHLADCPSCAEWSRQAARFDQIWEATRPPVPTSALMNSLWASASDALENPPTLATLRLEGLESTRRRSWVKPLLVLAQAAAILLAAGFFLLRSEPVQVATLDKNEVKPTLAQPVQKTTVESVGDLASLDFPELPRLLVNDGETLFVSIPTNSKEPAKVTLHPEVPSLSNSNTIPLGTPHDIFSAWEVTTVAVR